MGRSLLKAFLSIFSARMVTSVVALVTLPLVVRILGPGGYGDFAFIISTFDLLMILVSSGVTEGSQKFVGEDRDGEWREKVVGFYGRLAVLLAVVGALGVALFANVAPVDRWLGPEFRTYFYLLAVWVVAAQFRALVRRVLMGMGLETYSEPLRVVNSVGWVAVGLVLAQFGWGVEGFILGHVLASAAVAVVGGVLVARKLSLRTILSPLPESFPRRQLLSFNFLNILLVLLVMSLYHVDVVMLRTLVGDDTTGYYKSALAVAEYLWFVPLSLQALLLHSTSDLWVDEDHEKIEEISTRATRYSLLLTVLLALGIGALAGRFVPLYFGPEFADAVTPLRVLLPGAVAFAVVRPVYAIAQANGNLKPLVAATGLSALLNFTLNALLIPRYEMIGAAVATGVGYGSMLAFHVASARRLGFDPLADIRIGRVTVTAVAAAIPIFGATALLDRDLLALAVVPPLGFVVFVGAAVRTGAIGADELAELETTLPVSIPAPIRAFAASVVPSEERGGE